MTLRKISHNGTNGNALVEIGEDVTEAHPYKQNGHATEKVAKKVDWEIPRKTLHASIGVLCCLILADAFLIYCSQGSLLSLFIRMATTLALLLLCYPER